MSTQPLPSTLDIRKAAVRGVAIRGSLKPVDLKRFRQLLAGDEGAISALLTFSRDEQNRYLVRVELRAEVTVACQRCLQFMSQLLTSDSVLTAVWNDEQAAQLPRHLEPLIVTDEDCNLWELVEDELILSLPSFSYHDTQECHKTLAGFTAEAPAIEAAAVKPNPFDLLEQLKPGSK